MITIEIKDNCEYSNLSHNFTAPFCILFERFYFPDQEWFDFPAEILGMWTEELLNLLRPNSPVRTVTLYLLDGNYYLKCSKINEQFLITAFNDDRQVYEANITVIDFLQQVQSACEQVVLMIGRHHYEVNNYNKFLMKIKKLKTLIQKMIQPL